jgi:hypothetical protein
MCAIRLARAPSVWLAHAPSGMCALRLACTRSSWLVHLPLDSRALPWACVPSNPLGLERPHFGPRALPWAHAHSLWKPQILEGKRHVRAPLGMCAICLTRAPFVCLAHALSGKCPLRLACMCSSWLLCLPIGLCVLPWACVPSDSHARTPLGLTALSLARARYLGHVRTPLRMRALHLETPNSHLACAHPHLCAPSLGMCAPSLGMCTPSPSAPLQKAMLVSNYPNYPCALLSFCFPLACGILGCALTWHVRTLTCVRPHLACARRHLACARPHLCVP